MSYQTFCDTFHPHLQHSRRWEMFKTLARFMYNLNRPVFIVETGCLRYPNNWTGDGQSTKLWEFIAKDTGGKATSIDISRDNIEVARVNCPGVKTICDDSIRALSIAHDVEKIDLLYLDSYDYDEPYPLSMLHHVGELAAVWERLQFGCIIAVDDCLADYSGKHVYVQQFMDDMEMPMIADGYIRAWQKT